MRVLHVIPSLGASRGGPSFVMKTLARGLAESGVDVHIATTDDDGKGRLDVKHGVPIEDGGVTYWFFPRQTRFYSVSWPLSRWLAMNVAGYDVVHIHALFSFPSVAAAYWARRKKAPYVVRPLGTLNRWSIQNRRPLMKKLSLRLLEVRILRAAAAVHFTSEQERLEAQDCCPTDNAVVIPNPLDREDPAIDVTRGRLRSQYPALAERVWILFLSRIDPKKGLDLLLPAFARLRALHPGAALIVAGDGDPGYVKSLRGLAAKLGVEADIVWTGFITGEEKRAALTDCDVFALPSYSENFGVAALDAMASGLPLVVSDQVAIHKEIAEAGAGLVVPCSEDAVLEALVATVRDAPLRFRLGRNARLAAQQFSVEKVVVRLLDLYAQTAAHGRPEDARAARTSA